MQDVLDAIMFAIANATYTERITDRSWHTEVQQHNVVKKENLPYIKSAITGELVKITSHIAELEAKVTAYEAIISNSNFAPILQVSYDNTNYRGNSYDRSTDNQ